MSGKLLYYHFYSLGALNKKTLRDAHEQILTWPALIYRSLQLTYRDLHFSASTCITQITPTNQHRIYNGQSLIALNPVTQQLYYRTDENTVHCRVIDEESRGHYRWMLEATSKRLNMPLRAVVKWIRCRANLAGAVP